MASQLRAVNYDNCSKGVYSHPYPYHHTLELEIESLTNLGLGLGRDQGWLFKFRMHFGRKSGCIYRNNKNYSSADCISVLQPSPHRVSPRCPLFGECGEVPIPAS